MFDQKMLKEIMKAHGERNKDLAAALGVSPQNFSMTWNGRQKFSLAQVRIIALRYDLTPDQVWDIFLKEEP